MKQKVIREIIEKKLLILSMIVMIVIGGITSYLTIPKQHFPEVVLPVATVSVVYPGASAEDMEELITKKLEEVIRETVGFDSCSTTSVNSVSAAMVSLNKDMSQEDADASFDDLRQRVEQLRAQLPSGVTSISVDTDVMDTAGVILAVTGDDISGDELGQRTDQLKDQLKLRPGIRKVDVYGKQNSEVAIHVDARRLNALDVSLTELSRMISAQNSTIPTGTIDVGESVMTVNSSGKFENLDEIKNIVVGRTEEGTLIKLSDLADIQIQEPEDSAHFTYNKKKANLIVLYFNSGINVVDFGDSIRQCVEEYSSTLPETVQVNEVYFQPDVVDEAIGGFVKNLLESILLVLVVVMLGMNFRNGLVVSAAIPLAIFINFIVMRVMGTEIQFISLAALIIVLGMLVDNAIVITDAIQTKLDEGLERKEAAIEGTSEVLVPVFISMLTTTIAFDSLLALSGAYRQLAFTLPVVIITCLAASFIVAVVVTPLISFFFLKAKHKKRDGSQKLVQLYDRIFTWAFHHKITTIVTAFVFLIVCSCSLTIIDMQVIPKAFKDVVTIEIAGNNENDIEKTEKIVEAIETILDQQPETRYYLSGIGTGIPRYDYSILPKSSGKNVGDIFLRLDLKKGDRFKETYEMVGFLQKELDARISDATILVDELGIMAGTTKPVEMKLYSENIQDLNEAAEIMGELMRQLDGVKNITTGQELATFNYYVNMDTTKLSGLGLMKGEVQNELSIALMGRNVSLYRENGKEYPVVLDSDLSQQNELNNFRIKSSASGNKYALRQFADIELQPEVSSIKRLDGRRGRAVGCYCLSGYSDITTQMKLEKMIKNTEFPESVTMEQSGMKHDFITVLNSIAGVAVLSIVIIFLILMFQFNSIRIPLLVFISVPFGVMAGIAGLFVSGESLTFFGLLGCVSLLGCVLSNAIVLVEFINQERSSGIRLEEACRSAGRKRFRPILMSTMTTVLGLVPLAFGGDALFIPMARLMMAGLAVSMVVNLVLVPIIYYMIQSKAEA
ncbi:MAG: efflux RND transporter permease subunit [Lachnospiraceae bacterium]|nr:efflux RND transporter permease subunit [Lachnospiraceae bacterium]